MSSSESAAPDPNNDLRIDASAWLHFAGVGGSGMSALAQFHALAGGRVTGSDRAFDQGERAKIRKALEAVGVQIVPQDGSVFDEAGCQAVVVSTAVEDRVPDVRAAKAKGVPILHRSELLARYVAAHRTIAVTGTSGKSTVTAMVFAILQSAGRAPGLLTGGALAGLQADGHLGNAWAPGQAAAPAAGQDPVDEDLRPYLVIEADESDGSVVRYRPWAGVVLNLGLDHKTPAEVLDMFHTFRINTGGPFVVAADGNLSSLHLGAHLFGVVEAGAAAAPAAGTSATDTFATDLDLQPDRVAFTIDDVRFTLPHPGRYNVLNATAAVAVCRAAGVALTDMVAPLAEFAGVARRFNSVGTARGVEVIDDFAHNPDKITAALAAAHTRVAAGKGRVLAVFQPHGFGPTRFLRTALVETFAAGLGPNDVVWIPEIYFAGGTVTRDISADDLVQDIREHGRDARFRTERSDLPELIVAEARPGDLVLVMGARDPSLTGFCREILARLMT